MNTKCGFRQWEDLNPIVKYADNSRPTWVASVNQCTLPVSHFCTHSPSYFFSMNEQIFNNVIIWQWSLIEWRRLIDYKHSLDLDLNWSYFCQSQKLFTHCQFWVELPPRRT